MNHAVRSPQSVPYASFDSDDEEISVVRRISWRSPQVDDAPAPAPVYVSVLVPDGGDTFTPRRLYLGTRFELGIIPSSTWRDELESLGVTEMAIEFVGAWLAENSL